MKKILITGGAGFIGSHTADALIKRGYQVRILDSLESQIHGQSQNYENADAWPLYLNPSVEKIKGDIRDEHIVLKALQNVDVVYHLASFTGVGQSMYDINRYVDVNIRGTAVLLETILKHKIKLKKFILSSSRAVYGEGTQSCAEHGEFHPYPRSPNQLQLGQFTIKCPWCNRDSKPVAVREEQTCLPSSIYGWTKLAQEQMCQQMSLAHGFPITILRYFNVYGSRQALNNPYTGIVSIFTQQLKNRVAIKLFEQGLPVRDFVHVSDVVNANLAILDKDIFSGVVLNIGSGQPITVEALAHTLSKKMNYPDNFEKTDLFRVGDIFSCTANINKANSLLNWTPKQNLSEGLDEFFNWAKQAKFTMTQKDQAGDELKTYGLLIKATQERI